MKRGKPSHYLRTGIKRSRIVTYIGLLIALEIIFTRFLSFEPFGATWRVGFGFIPTSIAGYLLGPLWGALETVLADIVGFFLFYRGAYPFHLGYTLSCALRGIIYGLLLFGCRSTGYKLVLRCVLSAFMVFVLIDLGLNAYWSMALTGNPYLVCVGVNLASAAGNFAIRCVLMPVYILFMQKNKNILFKN